MADGVSADLTRDLDLTLGNQRPSDGCAQQVVALILGVGAEHREDEVAHELFAQVVDEDVLGLDAQFQGFLARRAQLFALAQVGSEGHHLGVIFGLEPLQDDRGVQPARIGEDDFLDGLVDGGGHGGSFSKGRSVGELTRA